MCPDDTQVSVCINRNTQIMIVTTTNETPVYIEAQPLTNIKNTCEVNSNIFDDSDHLELSIPTNLNDADIITSESEKPQFPETEQDQVPLNDIINIPPENDDVHEEEHDSDNSSVNEAERNEPPPYSCLNVKTRKKRKCPEGWNYNINVSVRKVCHIKVKRKLEKLGITA